MEALLASLKPPKPLIFDHNAKLNLEVFLNHLDIYLKATGLNPQDDITKIAIFLSHAGEEAQNKFYSFKLTDTQRKKYESVIEAFKDYCKPFKSETQERFKFFTRVQQKGEDFDHFLTAVKCLAKECNFGDLEDSLVRDKIVSSVLDISLREELLRIPNITSHIVENRCRMLETNKHRLKLQLTNSQYENLTTETLGVEQVVIKVEHSDQQAADSPNFGCEINIEEMNTTKIKLEEFSIDIKDETFESRLDEESDVSIIKHDEKRFICATCGFRFSQKRSLAVHMKTHTGEKPYTCDVCSRKFSHSGTLKNHVRTHTGDKPFACEICGYRCSQKGYLKLHLRNHAGVKSFVCEFCNAKFSQKGNLVTHLRIHTGEKPFACEICGYRCSQKGYLNLHLRTHAGEKSFSCKFCDAKFSQKGNLTSHLRTHTGEKPFACDICDYRCSQKGYLKLHLKNHTGEKSYSCEFCDAKFAQKGNLRSHLLTHTGEKPFACKICDYKCSQRGMLKSHLRSHDDDKPFACDNSEYKSTRKAGLKVHVRTHTGEKLFSCEACDFKCTHPRTLQNHAKKLHTK